MRRQSGKPQPNSYQHTRVKDQEGEDDKDDDELESWWGVGHRVYRPSLKRHPRGSSRCAVGQQLRFFVPPKTNLVLFDQGDASDPTAGQYKSVPSLLIALQSACTPSECPRQGR